MRRTALVSSALALAVAVAAAPFARATWSICLTDTSTGEVAIGTVTCINNADLEKFVPIVRVGLGVGACQSLIDAQGVNKKIIWNELPNGTDPATMLQMMQAVDSQYQWRQIGIVDLQARGVTFTGTKDGLWAGGVTGHVGAITYAIQGNVLTGQPVITLAEQAILNTAGDLGQKLMAGMEAARSMGGDGRCSCNASMPQQCGSPPSSFTRSGYIGCVIVARIGDTDGTCVQPAGCSTGQYYLELNINGQQAANPDPVVQMQAQYATWRASLAGRPDHVKSKNVLNRAILHADGVDGTQLGIRLFDVDGVAIPAGGASVSVTVEPGASAGVTIGTVNDLGTGEYRVPITAQNTVGKAKLRVVVNDGLGPVTLYPFPEVTVAKSPALSANVSALSASAGTAVNFTLDGGAPLAARPYLLLCSASGTTPGFWQGSVYVPLVHDFAVDYSVVFPNLAPFTSTLGALDASGVGAAGANFPAGLLAPLVGGSLSFSFVTLSDVDFASEAVSLGVQP